MQVHQSEFRSMVTCASTVFRNEGLSAFYVSYPTTLTMTVPFTAAQFTVYEQIKKFMNPTGTYSPVSHIVAGGIGGGVAAGLTTPLDVAKTLLQTRGTSSDLEIRHCRGMLHAFQIIWARDGVKGFFRGLSPRVVTHMPSSALCWMSYEFFSAFFSLPRPSNSADHDCFSYLQRLQFAKTKPSSEPVVVTAWHTLHPHRRYDSSCLGLRAGDIDGQPSSVRLQIIT